MFFFVATSIREDKPGSHLSQRQIARNIGISRSSLQHSQRKNLNYRFLREYAFQYVIVRSKIKRLLAI